MMSFEDKITDNTFGIHMTFRLWPMDVAQMTRLVPLAGAYYMWLSQDGLYMKKCPDT